MKDLKKELNTLIYFIETNSEFIDCVDKIVGEFERRLSEFLKGSPDDSPSASFFGVINLLQTVLLFENFDKTMTKLSSWYEDGYGTHIVKLRNQLLESEELLNKIARTK